MRIGQLAGVVAILALGGSERDSSRRGWTHRVRGPRSGAACKRDDHLRRVGSGRRVHAADSTQCVGGRHVQDAPGVLSGHGAADADA